MKILPVKLPYSWLLAAALLSAGAGLVFGYANYNDCRCNQASPFNSDSDNIAKCCSYTTSSWYASNSDKCSKPCSDISCTGNKIPSGAATYTTDSGVCCQSCPNANQVNVGGVCKTPCGSCQPGYFRNVFNYQEDAAAAYYACCSSCDVSLNWVNGTCPYSNYNQQQLTAGQSVTYCYDTNNVMTGGTTEIGVKIDQWDHRYTECAGSTGKNCSNNCDYCSANGQTYYSHWFDMSCKSYTLALPASDILSICQYWQASGNVDSNGYVPCYYTCAGSCGTTENYRIKCSFTSQYKTMTCNGW